MKFFSRHVVASLVAFMFCLFARIAAQSPMAESNQALNGSTALRVVVDPALNSSCWILKRDPNHPQGPGRWVQAPIKESSIPFGKGDSIRATGIPRMPVHPVIRPGDQLVIGESSDLVEARLQAVALGRAASGEILEVRLRTTGKVLRAVALAPGLAEFADRHEVRP
jgi:hypothetical protein